MTNRREFLKTASLLSLMAAHVHPALAQNAANSARPGRKGLMLMNRIGPSASDLYIANSDGTGERKLLREPGFDLHGTFSNDGASVIFTSERAGGGQADIYRARVDGSGLERLTDHSAMDDQAVLSPDGRLVAFVSTRDGFKANIWILDLQTRALRNLTGGADIQGAALKPGGFFRPAWSPDGKQIAFSSDRNTGWRSRKGAWEHVQELSIYVVDADGKGFRRVYARPDVCAGSPKWSADGKRIVFYELPVEHTWHAHRPELVASAVSQILSLDVASGAAIAHTSGPGLKISPQFLATDDIAYLAKGRDDEGLISTKRGQLFKGKVRAPSWSSDGKQVIYVRNSFTPRPQNKPLFSWSDDLEYQYTDVFPNFSAQGELVITEKDLDSSLAIMNPDGSSKRRIFQGGRGSQAFAPSWSPDGQWIAFGLGNFFGDRDKTKAKVMIVRRDGTDAQDLTSDTPHTGFPGFSADGKQIVYRVWGEGNYGLRILTIADKSVRVLTNDTDNLPGWSPDGQRIVFTRRGADGNFDIFTIRPDGSDLKRLTDSGAVDAHAVWSTDGKKILWNSGMNGWRDEAALYDNTFQPYAPVFSMNPDGSDKRQLTDSMWEDGTAQFAPAG